MKREKGLDFVRAIGVIGVVAFHFSAHSNSEQTLFLTHANGAWGGTMNYLFFMLSGLVLHLKYGAAETIDLKHFYYKRWKATMPAYLFSFACTFLLQILKSGKFFHSSVPLYRLLYSLVGMDGYFNLFFPTFFLVGEWFLSAILLLYILYPLLNQLMKKSVLLPLLGLVVLHILIFYVDFWGISPTVNLIPCLLCMYIGMLLARSPKCLKSPAAALTAALFAAVYITIYISTAYLTGEILVAMALLIFLNYIGDYLCRISCIDRFITMISRYSFYVFLIQHRLIIKVIERYNPTNTLISFGLLVGILIAALVFSHIFSFLINRILNSRLYARFENTIMGSNL